MTTIIPYLETWPPWAGDTACYGRSPAMDATPSLLRLKESTVHLLERMACGWIFLPPGVTIYRAGRNDWRLLPEPTR